MPDPDLCMQAAVRSDVFQYWEYVLIYVDDLLVISENSKDILAKIDYYFSIKPDSIGPPSMYLGAKLVISENPKDILVKIDYYFSIKPDSIGPPSMYLGAKLSKCPLKNGNVA